VGIFENMFTWGYAFVIIVAGLALITAYYNKKGYIKFQSPIKKIKGEDKDVN
jgi:uncharacterized oligopeptide transporter (OPT) family protein